MFASALSMSPVSDTINTEQGVAGSVQFTLTNNDAGNLTYNSISLAVADPADFRDDAGNQITITFSGNEGELSNGVSKTINITALPEVDQYIGGLSGDIIVTVTKSDGSTETANFNLNVNTISEYISVDLDDLDDLEDLEPGDDISFTIQVDNDFSEDLKDVRVKVWIINLDNGDDDLEDTSSKEDIDEGDNMDYDFSFTVPLNAESDDYSIKVLVDGETDSGDDFESTIFYNGVVEIIKDEEERVEFSDISVPTQTLTCGSTFTVSATVVNTGEDNLPDMYLKLFVDGTNVELTSEEFDLDADDFDDSEQDVDFFVTLPNSLAESSYQLRVLAYNEDGDTVGGEYPAIQVNPCATASNDDEDNDSTTNDDEQQQNTDSTPNTVYLPTGFTSAALDKDTWTTIFWILGDVLLVIVAIYFVVLIFKRRR